MMSFNADLLRQPLPFNLVRALTRVGELRGKQDLWKQQSRRTLEGLLENAKIESAVASNEIEGVRASPERVDEVLREGAAPRTRPEEELAGYKYVLEMIHKDHENMQFTPNLVLQLHRDLFKYSSQDSGRWKSVDNQILERSEQGHRTIRFQPTPAWQTPEAMRRLHDGFLQERDLGQVEPILLIAAYVLDFLCIHAFLDGNGRLSRLLTLLLLYQAGYEVGKWISLEKTVEETREHYYATLHASSQDWHTARHQIIPWWEYFAGIMMLQAYEKLANRVGDLSAEWGSKGTAVEAAIRMAGPVFRKSDIQSLLPGVSEQTIARTLSRLKAAGQIEPTGTGRSAAWRKV